MDSADKAMRWLLGCVTLGDKLIGWLQAAEIAEGATMLSKCSKSIGFASFRGIDDFHNTCSVG